MIHLLHGKDTYRVRRRLLAIRESLDPEGLLAGNASTLDGAAITPGELLAHASAVPFLASSRLVVVDGLIAALASERRGRAKKDDDPLAAWRDALASLRDPAVVPESTVLVFLEGAVDKRTQAFTLVAKISAVEEFDVLGSKGSGAELAEWVTKIADEQGARLAPRAMVAIAQLSGGDLWAVESELARLTAYTAGEVIDAQTVSEISNFAHDTKMWDMTDAVLVADERKALVAMQRLMDDGIAAQILFSMLVRQVRQLVIARDLKERGVPGQIAAAAGVPEFRAGALAATASRYSWPALRSIYQRLLEADLAVKRGDIDIQESLQLLIHELSAAAPVAASRRPAPSRR